jgi:hypothetical protein
VKLLVDYVREVAIKLHCFVHYYILVRLDDNRDILQVLFTWHLFFFLFLHIVCGWYTNYKSFVGYSRSVRLG